MQIASKNHRFAIGLFFASTGLTVAFASCTDSYDKDLSGSSGTPGGSGSAAGGAGGNIFDPDAMQCVDTCSNDLKSVLDCFGKVKTACTPDEGCYDDGNGPKCIPGPCKAAELSKSSYGCDYWALKTAQRPQADGACFAAYVANTWSKPVHLQVERGMPLDPKTFAYIPSGQGMNITYTPYDPVAGLAVGDVAILFLSRGPGGLLACPPAGSSPAVTQDTGVLGTGRGTAFHITTDYPVVAYQIAPYGGGMTSYASATLLIPTSAWDLDYLAISAYQASQVPGYNGNPSLNILANQDMTTVKVTPTADIIPGANVPGTMKGTPVMYTLNKGEFIQLTQPAELTGSGISADKPIAVFGAHTCMTLPNMQLDCDSAQQQIAPVHALGNEYVGVRYKNRTGQDEAPPWRVVGAVDGTNLVWDPAPPPGAPKTLNVGQVAEFSAPGPFVVRSQDLDHPFYLGGYMTGSQPYNDIGDPEWVNVIPPLQYLNNYVLFTDPTYPETSLVVVRAPSKFDGKFVDITLDCLGKPLDGWQPIGTSNYQYTIVDIVAGNFMGVNGCTNGRLEMSSTLPFGVTVWGWGTKMTNTSQVSYAYPAGAGFRSINSVPPIIPK